MNAPREPGSSVLGKRSHQIAQVDTSDSSVDDSHKTFTLPTPDSTPNPKRAKTSTAILDGDNNKENIPPFMLRAINGSPSNSRLTRSLRRTSTMVAGVATRSPSTPRRYASISDLRQVAAASATPSASLAQLSLATPPPTPPSSLLPIHVRARALLRPTCNDVPQFAGRTAERQKLESFLISFLAEHVGLDVSPTLYVSGAPGTGKTALVNAVLTALESQLQEKDVRVLSMNCMALGGVDAVWQRLARILGDDGKSDGKAKKVKETAKQIVERVLASSTRKCVLVLDELDHIASSTQSLAPLFALANARSSCLRMIGIANTHTLTSSGCTTFSVQSVVGVETLHFPPYTPEQLLDILQIRLAPLSGGEGSDVATRAKKFLPLPTMTLLSKKIAAQTGDVRAVFEVLRGAIDIAVTAVSAPDPLNVPVPSVTPSHILSALKAYAPAGRTTPAVASTPSMPRKTSDSEAVTKVRELGLQQRLVLLSMLLAVKSADAGVALNGSTSSSSPSRSSPKRTQSTATVQSPAKQASFELGHLYSFYSAMLARAENGVFVPVSRSEFGDLAGVLEVVGLVSLSSSGSSPSTPRKSGKKAFSRSASFAGGFQSVQEARFVDGVRLEEVARGLGLGVDDVPADVREEEVRAIYHREQARIAREAKALGKSSRAEVVGFEEAMED